TKALNREVALLAMLYSAPVFILFIASDKMGEGLGAWFATGIIVASITVNWDLRRNLWFWIAIMIAILLQIPFVQFVPWTDRYMSFVGLLAFGLLDYALVYGCIQLVRKRARRGEIAFRN